MLFISHISRDSGLVKKRALHRFLVMFYNLVHSYLSPMRNQREKQVSVLGWSHSDTSSALLLLVCVWLSRNFPDE